MKVALLSETSNATAFLADDAWCAQEKLNGERMLVQKSGTAVTAHNRQGEARALPDTVEAVALTSGTDFVLDGEWIAGEFVAFDVISINGTDVSALPQAARFAALAEVSPFRLVRQALSEDKHALLASVREEKGEGLVFKLRDAAYFCGRTEVGVKFKFWKSASFLVKDLDIAKGTVGLGGFGRCSFPFAGAWPKVGDIVEVRYLLLTKNGKLSQPAFLGVRSDLTAADVAAQVIA
jgi:bifunctional non-homologous end joining protein LigD